MDTNKIFIFGNGEISQMVSYYFKKENKFDILGYVVDDDKFRENSFLKKKIITTSELITEYSSKDIKLHIAISYTNLNKNTPFNFYKS